MRGIGWTRFWRGNLAWLAVTFVVQPFGFHSLGGLTMGARPLVEVAAAVVAFWVESVPLPPLEKVVEFYEAAANIMHPCRVIGVAVNGNRFEDDAVAAECERVNPAIGPARVRRDSPRPATAGRGGDATAN